jgi:hypothetical protein
MCVRERPAAARASPMPASTVGEPSPSNRAKKTNQPFSLPGVDMRSSLGRRYADIVRALRAEFGDQQPGPIAELAVTRLALERLQTAIVKGETVDANALVRLSNLSVRQESRLRVATSTRKDRRLNVDEYLSRKGIAT